MSKTLSASLVVGVACLLLAACNAGKNETNIELIQDMMDQISLKTQDWDPLQNGKAAGRTPPAGTVAQNQEIYKYWNDPVAAGNNLKNPFSGNKSPEVLSLGKTQFGIYCAVCHGNAGMGDGTVAPKMALRPPSLMTDKVKNFPDGRIFHIITAGQGVMGKYSNQIRDPKKRWAIVNYIRSLQENSSN